MVGKVENYIVLVPLPQTTRSPKPRFTPFRTLSYALLVGCVSILAPAISLAGDGLERSLDSLRFEELTPLDNSPLGQVNDLIQGPRGFIWIASDRGALRYDGYDLTSYTRDANDPNSLHDNSVWTLLLDDKNQLWLGTHQSVSRYNEKEDNFTNYPLIPGETHSNVSNRCNAIIQDERGRLYAGSESGVLYQFDPAADRFVAIVKDQFQTIKSMAVSPGGLLWVGGNSAVHSLDPETRQVRRYTDGLEAPKDASNNFIYDTAIASDGSVWLGTAYSGLVRLDPKTGDTTTVSRANALEARIRALSRLGEHHIWACHRNGITLYDTRTLSRAHSYSVSSRLGSLPFGTINTLLVDDQENIWVGTYKQGLYLAANNKAFQAEIPFVLDFAPGVTPVVSQIHLDQKGRQWYGFVTGGIRVRGPDGELAFALKHDPADPQSLGAFNVYDIAETRDGTIWVGSYDGGLFKFNEETRDFTRYLHDPENPSSIGGNDIRGIAEDSDGKLWLALKGRGVSHFDPATGNAVTYTEHPYDFDRGLLNRWSSDVEVGADGRVYVATPEGLSIIDPETGLVENYQPDDDDPASLSAAYCYDLFRDSEDRIWIGTKNGLNRFDPAARSFVSYTVRDGMPSDQVFAIHQDLEGNIWAGCNSGLARLDPRTGAIKAYFQEDGLIYNAFLPDSVSRDASGILYFGQKRGVTYFRPSDIKENTHAPEVLITDVKSFYKSLSQSDRTESRFYIGKPALTLKYDKEAISIAYVAKNYIQASKTEYAYRLDGFDREWNHVGTRREAYYTNLNPGNYTFRVKARNRDGYWSDTEAKISLTITPPFWKLPIFYAFLVLVALGTIYFYIRLRERQQRRVRENLEKQVAERTATVRHQNQKLEIQHEAIAKHRDELEGKVKARTSEYLAAKERAEEADRLKSSFLANLSHEIRTPLNAVVGFSNLLRMGEYDAQERDEYVDIIDDNSQSLLRLIDDILDFSMIESNQLTIFEDRFPLNEFVEHIAHTHQLTLSGTDVAFKFQNPLRDKGYIIHSDRPRMKQILDNLLTNAIKFTKNGSIELRTSVSDAHLILSVIDTGKGIAAEYRDLIFEQFYKIQEDERLAMRGVGLGLAICKRLAHLLGGDLIVQSEQGVGSRFDLLFPLDKVTAFSDNNAEIDESIRQGDAQFPGKHVLIIEDEQTNYRLLESALRKYKVDVTWAEDGEAGIEAVAQKGPFDLIFLDIKLPGIDGYETHRRLREQGVETPIVAQTAYSMKGDEYRIRAAGFDEYLSKPISLIKLHHLVLRILASPAPEISS